MSASRQSTVRSPVTAPTALPQGRGALVAAIWTLAWPVIATFALDSLVGLVDTLMVGRLGAEALAGAGLGAQIFNALHVVMVAVMTGTVALVARHVGAGETARAEAVLAQSLVAVALASLAAAVPIAVWAPEVVALFGVDPGVREAGVAYVRVMMIGVPLAGIFFVFGAALRGAGDMRTTMWIGLIINVLNILLNYLLIFGHWGFPALGVAGAAAGSTVAYGLGALLCAVATRRPSTALRLRVPGAGTLAGIRRVLHIGVPTAAEQILMQIGFMLYLVVAAHYGTTAVAAYFIGVRILALCFQPGFGFAAAASTLVGQNLGAGRPDDADRGARETNRLAVAMMSAGGVLIFVFARQIALAFIEDPAVVADAVDFIRVLAVVQPLMATDFTLGGALRGAGDTRFPLLTVAVGFYLCRLGSAALTTYVFGLGLTWVWLALVGDYGARAILKWLRFRTGAWKHVRV